MISIARGSERGLVECSIKYIQTKKGRNTQNKHFSNLYEKIKSRFFLVFYDLSLSNDILQVELWSTIQKCKIS